MQCKPVTSDSSEDRPRLKKDSKEFLESRRVYNRLYMRAWRADPRHHAVELLNRQRWHYERKLRCIAQERRPFTDDSGNSVCGFCRKDPPVLEVMRLLISPDAAARFIPIRVPYCGHC